MPHVQIKTYPGVTEEQKTKLSDAITNAITSITGKSEAVVSISIEDVPESEWMEKVYKTEIQGTTGKIYKQPGY